MRVDVIIGQIKAYCPFFAGNVAGAAAYAEGVDSQVWLQTPAAYVVPLEGDATANTDQGGALNQMLTERVNVIVQFDNRSDRRGQTVTENLEPVKYQLFGALLNWRPNSSVENPGIIIPGTPGADVSARGMSVVAHGLVAFDLARLFYRWTFELEVTVTDADGWKPTGVPLVGVQGTITSPESGETLAKFQNTFSS
jgi:hypothetical protein